MLEESPKSLRVGSFPDNHHHGDSVSSPAPWICFTFTIDSGVRNGHNGNFRSDSSCFLLKSYRYANLDWTVGRFCCLISTVTYNIRELTNRRLSHDDAVGSPYSTPPSSGRNLNLRFAVKTVTFMRDRQIFSPFLKFVFIF